MIASAEQELKAFAIENDGARRLFAKANEVSACSLQAGLREAENLVVPVQEVLDKLGVGDRQDVEAALMMLPAIYMIDKEPSSEHLDWLLHTLSPFDRVSAPKSVAVLPDAVRLKRRVTKAETAVKAIVAENTTPVLDDHDLAVSGNPIARSLAEPELTIAERKAKFFDCQKALGQAVMSSLPRDQVFGVTPLVVELGTGLALAQTMQSEAFDLYCIEQNSALGTMAQDFSDDIVVCNLDTLDPERLKNCSILVVNGWSPEIVATCPLQEIVASKVNVVLLDQIDSFTEDGYRSYMSLVLDRMAQLFPGCSYSLRRFQLLGHKPWDLQPQSVLIELEVFQ
ncbi:hypothetical protein PXK17_21450 [Phaeobacter gallaeciensis]|uniref:Class I SAM-dependent methyltransferase n=1 Tax=Phaeobacter gallaeciensis TaxID=60890 RepID=A0ABD4XFW4_9RHOB|nr:hypothetical protein [Phaeobacter gallaeciensis]MDE4147159.1 hypothetical protein [Phaeobacter gallaeciensis]MDE4159800.1 hypothetical protein [Phaeobacter gallaeciensis]MDE4164019.1 hypothetical protein [Phaeobacter gallaeciensis]MDE4168252.1 hypothetical protein [Phaeobacter gallaeciensis]MDE4172474.1 hypothetical protein [Phaeobacter gallaeciensis]